MATCVSIANLPSLDGNGHTNRRVGKRRSDGEWGMGRDELTDVGPLTRWILWVCQWPRISYAFMKALSGSTCYSRSFYFDHRMQPMEQLTALLNLTTRVP